MFVALRCLEGRQSRLERHSEGALGRQLVQSEVLQSKLLYEALPSRLVQEVFVRLNLGTGGEGKEPHGLLHHRKVLQLSFSAEKLLGVFDRLQLLPSLDELQVFLEPDLELQTGLELPEPALVVVTPGHHLVQLLPDQALLHLPGSKEHLQHDTLELKLNNIILTSVLLRCATPEFSAS